MVCASHKTIIARVAFENLPTVKVTFCHFLNVQEKCQRKKLEK